MNTPDIHSFQPVSPMIYAYTHPDYPPHQGWSKIGYTERQSVHDRIEQQNHTSDIAWALLWQDKAMYRDGSGRYFTDHDFHRYLQRRQNVERKPKTEWFHIDGEKSRTLFDLFVSRRLDNTQSGYDYELRNEQNRAVEMTKAYFEGGGNEFLWNAKPRFGKTLTVYDLVRRMGLKKVLIVTNRPSIANSWADDFTKFIGWRGELCFVSETDALRDHPGVLTREEYLAGLKGKQNLPGMVTFISLQDLKGSVYFGGDFQKLRWMAKEVYVGGRKEKGLEFDLLIVDESQEGVDTMRTERAFRNIGRKYTLYLSGTPFKQLASDQFKTEQIFNWSYADEQDAKEKWDCEEYNPYENLPRLSMYTYQLSPMIYDTIQRGVDLSDDETVDYAFDLNEFFATNESKKFVHEEEVRKFLRALCTQEKYPFSTPELRRELSHTMWYLNRVDSVKALAKLLKEDTPDNPFREYEVIIAAGDGRESDNDDAANAKAFDRVKAAIAKYDKTITLTVGQLTVGVTIPEWSGVLMLCNMQSPSSYMQAAFRSQNPCTLTSGGQRFRKENAYLFDFDPARTLIIFDEFANNLSSETAGGRGTGEDRERNIRRLLNFFPVIGEDDEGKMVELDAKAVLSIPRKLKSQEVVRHGFMSNFLFQNISNIFGAPSAVQEIIQKLTPAQEDPKKNKRDNVEKIGEVSVDDNGEADIPKEIVIGRTQELFGPKVYETMRQDVTKAVEAVNGGTEEETKRQIRGVMDAVKRTVQENVVAPAVNNYDVKKSVKAKVERDTEREIEKKLTVIQDDYMQQSAVAKAELERAQAQAVTREEVKAAQSAYQETMRDAMRALATAVETEVKRTIEEKPVELVEQLERHEAEEKKRGVEEDVRAHLRGFARTIPSFLMAYGNDGVTLANFDRHIEKEVFWEVTGITLDDFRFLRDGGDYTDSETGEVRHFAGHLFDEVVFNDSIQEFLKKRAQLANYFDEAQEEDIFDYIPPQKTNQIFTPKWVVQMMVDQLEENNPGCFDDPDNTFADLYMKSGLYITEIVKRLYRSEKMKALFPDDKERIRHILQKQVYGMAPTQIIYRIATNYILGFDPDMKDANGHFVRADAADAAKNGTLQRLVNQSFD